MLQLIARGYMYKEIAARLHLSVKTVESHVSNVLRKLQLSTRHELARWATEHRLICASWRSSAAPRHPAQPLIRAWLEARRAILRPCCEELPHKATSSIMPR